MGEAPARSSLVPRDLTAEVVFDTSRFARGRQAEKCLITLAYARAFTCAGTPYGVCGWRDGDFLFGLTVCALAVFSPGWRPERSEGRR